MKKTFRFLSMAALALVGAVMTGCSSDDNIIDTPQQPANNGKTVTLTMSVGLNGGGETRALAADGTKTFAAGETMAVIYKNNSGETAVAETEALVGVGDITDYGKSATFTVTLDDPDKTQNVTYVYPAAMANSDGSINYAALNSQNGTLATLASNLDLATYSGAWNAGTLPSATLANQLAILALTLKDYDGANNITSTITGMTLSDGTNSYTITPSSLSTIYVAIKPTTSANIDITANDGSQCYNKSLTGKTYAAGNGYNVSWRMPEALISNATTLDYGMVVCAAGHLHLAKTAVPSGCTAVGILGKVTATGHGLILALQDATKQSSNTINGWTSVTTYAGTTLKLLPDNTARGSLTSYVKLGSTTVSNWAVAQKSDYEAIFINLGSTKSNANGTTYDANVNAYITTGVGGTAMSERYVSATFRDDGYGWGFSTVYWNGGNNTVDYKLRPVLAF